MKLKQRVVISFAGVVLLCVVFVAFETLPKVPNLLDLSIHKGNPKFYDGSHISAIRKRLNKSNYSSDDFSPEGGDKFMGETVVRGIIGKNSGPTNTEMFFVNETDSDVDYMLHKLQKYDDSNFDINGMQEISYQKFLRILQKQNKGKGSSLPAYRNLLG